MKDGTLGVSDGGESPTTPQGKRVCRRTGLHLGPCPGVAGQVNLGGCDANLGGGVCSGFPGHPLHSAFLLPPAFWPQGGGSGLEAQSSQVGSTPHKTDLGLTHHLPAPLRAQRLLEIWIQSPLLWLMVLSLKMENRKNFFCSFCTV